VRKQDELAPVQLAEAAAAAARDLAELGLIRDAAENVRGVPGGGVGVGGVRLQVRVVALGVLVGVRVAGDEVLVQQLGGQAEGLATTTTTTGQDRTGRTDGETVETLVPLG
jgi:hypothetical protein